MLSALLFELPAPYKDVPRACELAEKSVGATEPMGSSTMIRCLLSGSVPVEQPIARARGVALAMRNAGAAEGAFMLYMVFLNDPKYTYTRAGKPDMDAYNALAALPPEQRAEQIEALDALGEAVQKGHVNAAVLMAAYVFETSAPGNVRLSSATGLAQIRGAKSEQLRRHDDLARQVGKLGTTHASVKAFMDAHTGALLAASIAYTAANEQKQCAQLRLSSTEAKDIENAQYLPLRSMLANTYLVAVAQPPVAQPTTVGKASQ